MHKIDDREGTLVIVSTSPDAGDGVEVRFAETLADFHTRFVPFREADKFAGEAERDAH